MKKKMVHLVRLLALLVCLSVFLCSCTPSGAAPSQAPANPSEAGTEPSGPADPLEGLPEVKWRFSTQSPSTNVVGQTANWIGEQVAERTNGKFQIEVYTDAILYSDRECIEAMIAGSIEAGQGSYGTISRFADYCNVVNLPYLVSDWEELNDLCFGESYAGARQLLADSISAAGLHPLSFYSTGLRNFTNNKRPVNTAADMEGLKVRVQQNDVYIDTFNALGAYPTPMAASEVLVSLQQGTIDAEENPLDFIYNDGFYEFQKYISCTKHIATFSGYYVNPAAWDALPAEYQEIYTQVINEACQRLNNTAQEEEAHYRQVLTDAGCEVIDLTPEALEEMKNICREKVWPKYEDKYSEFLSYFED